MTSKTNCNSPNKQWPPIIQSAAILFFGTMEIHMCAEAARSPLKIADLPELPTPPFISIVN